MNRRQIILASNMLLIVGLALLLIGVFAGPGFLVVIGALLELVAIVLARINRNQRKSRGH